MCRSNGRPRRVASSSNAHRSIRHRIRISHTRPMGSKGNPGNPGNPDSLGNIAAMATARKINTARCAVAAPMAIRLMAISRVASKAARRATVVILTSAIRVRHATGVHLRHPHRMPSRPSVAGH